jgi:hypothetical protein
MNKTISISEKSKTLLPVRMTLAFSRLCRTQSKIYLTKNDPRLSSSKFLKQAAIEKLLKLGFKKDYLESIS